MTDKQKVNTALAAKTGVIMTKRWMLIAMILLGTALAGATYTVNFEGVGETKTSYASGDVTLSGLSWNLTEVLIGDLTADFKNGARSARLRGYGTSAMTMLANKSGGLGTLSFQYRRYGTDAQVDWKAEYSVNNGASWLQIGSAFTAPASDVVQNFSQVVNVAGDVRIRIKRATESGTTNMRLNIDDINLTDYSGGTPTVAPTLQALNILAFPAVNEIALEWTPGNGSYRVVKINTVNSFTPPADGSNPSPTSTYGGSGEQVIYNSATEIIEGVPYNGCSVGGLNPETAYWFRIYEYNGTGNETRYLAATATGNPAMATTTEAAGTGYYTGISGYGPAIKGQLHTLVKSTHTTQYTYDGAKVQLYYTDEDPVNANNVIEIYTGWSVDKDDFGSGTTDWNREHTWSKSHGDFGDVRPAGTDLHHLRPCDATVNSTKSNKDFDAGGTPVTDASPPAGYSGTTGCYQTTNSWEPRDADKGDVARMIMYMAVRYEGDDANLTTDLELVDHIYSDQGINLPYYGKLSTLLQWHVQDPPDAWEARRNNRIEERQGNRNPFIDHPEYAQYIWTPVPTTATSISQTGFTANWSVPITATEYRLQVATDSLFTSLVAGYADYDANLTTAKAISGLSNTQTYYYRLRSFFETGYSMYSPFLAVNLLPNPIATLSASSSLYEYYLDQQSVTLTLNNCVFADAYLNPASFIPTGLPVGVSIQSVQYQGPGSAILILAYNGTDFDVNAQFHVSVSGTEIAGGTPLTSTALPILAFVETTLTIDIQNGQAILNITAIPAAQAYFIFASEQPYGGFQDSTASGAFAPGIPTRWTAATGAYEHRFFKAAATKP